MAFFSEVSQIVVPHRQALGLKGIQHERLHRHVRVAARLASCLRKLLRRLSEN